MPNLKDQKMGGPIKAIFKGKPGSRKSCAAITFPKPLYLFDIDKRFRSLIKWAIEDMKDPSILDGIEYDSYSRQDFSKFQAKINQIEANPTKYKTIVFDSLTSSGDLLISYALSLRGVAKDKGGIAGRKLGSVEMLTIEDFGLEAQGLTQILDILRGLPGNLILIAHIIEVTSKVLKDNREVTERSLLTAGKKIAEKIPVYFDEAYHFEVEPGINVGSGSKTVVHTDHTGWDWAKTALPLDKKIDITDKKLYDVMREQLKLKGVEV